MPKRRSVEKARSATAAADMERLWAPWRLPYVKELGKSEGGCFLCRTAASGDDRENLVVARSGSAFAMLNRWPYNNGHMLVAPNEHKADLSDMTEPELLDQLKLLKRCLKNLKSALSPEGFNVGANLGRTAGAGLADHLHWHIVPRWGADSNFMPVIAATKVIPQALDELWKLLQQFETGR